jgi:dTDP-4-amino-4,6-dideoxygalactose transaminase
VGLNGRMSEIHAAVAIASFRDVDEHVERRNELARRYREELSGVSGIDFPQVSDADRSTYKDFTILVDPDLFGVDADVLGRALAAVGIETRRYYSPPVHAMQAYRSIGGMNGHLPVTELVASRVLTLPMWSEMRPDQVTHVVDAMLRIRRYSKHSD